MGKKARIGLYLEDEEIKRQIKIAAARRGVSTTSYCTQAIEERLKREGEMGDRSKSRAALLARMDKLSREIGPIKETAAKLVKEGRRR
ncbi:MAG: type II toxin-antitoxin system VapB family antitoxin [Chloroflexi bacterium]|nr:type II toxin-antitoxin system VapB family antitoxin [Chloroflexota bacterium]